MKKLLFSASLGICCFLISCNSNSDNKTTGNDSTATNNSAMNDSQAQKNLMSLRDVYKGIENGDNTKFGAIADDFVDHDGPNGQEMKGGENIKKMLTDMHSHVKGLAFDITGDAASGDYVFVFGMFRGTAADASMGAPAGTKLDSHFADVIKFNKDGKASERWGFAEQNEMMKMMQSMPHQNMPNMKKDSTNKM